MSEKYLTGVSQNGIFGANFLMHRLRVVYITCSSVTVLLQTATPYCNTLKPLVLLCFLLFCSSVTIKIGYSLREVK